MADDTNITPGSGVTVRAIDRSGVLTQVAQIDVGGAAGELLLVADPTLGVPVEIKGFPAAAVLVNNPTAANLKVDASGVAVPVTDNSGSLTVDAPAATPVFVRLSTGSAAIDTIPVTGTVTANQGTPAGSSNRWLAQLHDGTTAATVHAGTSGLNVYIAGGSVTGGISFADKAAFTEGTSTFNPIGGEFIASPSAPSDGHVAVARITAARGLHVNLRDNAGAEIGSAAAPLRIDPVGTTAQPVKLKDGSGTSFSASNPLYVTRGGRARTRVTKWVALIASQTGTVLWTPTSSTTFYIEKIVLVVTTAGPLTIFDNSNAAANIVADSNATNWPTGVYNLDFGEPWASAAVNNVLKYTSGSALVGTIAIHGFEV